MTLIIVAAEGEGVLDRSWCALEMNLAMVVGGAGYLIDIYTHHEGEVQRLTDGLIARDNNNAKQKAGRDKKFSFAIIERALKFALKDTKAAVQLDRDNIVLYVQRQDVQRQAASAELLGAKLLGAKLLGAKLLGVELLGAMLLGAELLDATVRARYFVAALEAVVKAENGAALVAAGFEALGRSALPRLSLTSAIGEVHAHMLVRSLPSSAVEVLLPYVKIGDKGAMLVGTFLSSSKALTELGLRGNQIGDMGALGLGKALEVNASLTTLRL
ncbi:hypothetical protein T492DRAFT_1075839 [Pavlovales sp. CCMP2436]|nr:hypothetical protein T492DRAFT_1075839 [Pavlovales sp. CCMP2436]